jgi:hypothetical protein
MANARVRSVNNEPNDFADGLAFKRANGGALGGALDCTQQRANRGNCGADGVQ